MSKTLLEKKRTELALAFLHPSKQLLAAMGAQNPQYICGKRGGNYVTPVSILDREGPIDGKDDPAAMAGRKSAVSYCEMPPLQNKLTTMSRRCLSPPGERM